jgi:hypothetical protein
MTNVIRAECEWCHDRPGDYNMSPPDREYVTMIYNQCFRENFGKLGHRLVIEEGEKKENEIHGNATKNSSEMSAS